MQISSRVEIWGCGPIRKLYLSAKSRVGFPLDLLASRDFFARILYYFPKEIWAKSQTKKSKEKEGKWKFGVGHYQIVVSGSARFLPCTHTTDKNQPKGESMANFLKPYFFKTTVSPGVSIKNFPFRLLSLEVALAKKATIFFIYSRLFKNFTLFPKKTVKR